MPPTRTGVADCAGGEDNVTVKVVGIVVVVVGVVEDTVTVTVEVDTEVVGESAATGTTVAIPKYSNNITASKTLALLFIKLTPLHI